MSTVIPDGFDFCEHNLAPFVFTNNRNRGLGLPRDLFSMRNPSQLGGEQQPTPRFRCGEHRKCGEIIVR